MRAYCHQMDIAYAPWGMLWGSLDDLDGEEKILEGSGKKVGLSREIVCFAALRRLDGWVSPLCGTSNERRMRETIEGLEKAKTWVDESEENKAEWEIFLDKFRGIVDSGEEVKKIVSV